MSGIFRGCGSPGLRVVAERFGVERCQYGPSEAPARALGRAHNAGQALAGAAEQPDAADSRGASHGRPPLIWAFGGLPAGGV